ncbi:MAG TPA: hypothetical protein VLH79_00235 [Chthonomonadales bacterium]|nr:hypothetical protein [Chthonomonadales bacterium]
MTHNRPWLGRVWQLLCADSFDGDMVRTVRDERGDLLHYRFGRALDDGSVSQEHWDREELPYYAAQIREPGPHTLMVNDIGTPELGHAHFGGAWVVCMGGSVRASVALVRERLLVCDLAG